MNVKDFFLATLALTSTGIQVINAQQRPPNILFLLADDLGYGELGCYGQKVIQTPVLDKLASQGMRFTQFYAGNSVSSPSRAVLMTGKPAGECTIRANHGYFAEEESWNRVTLRKDETTLPEMLKKANYQTAFFGKWHVEDPHDLDTWAHKRGFDHAAQEQWGANSTQTFTTDMEYINGMQDSLFYDYSKWQCKDEFRTQMAFDYLDSQLDKEKPFFLFMSYRAPHAHEFKLGNKDIYADRGWTEPERIHAGQITLLDQQVGRMLEKLEQMGLLDNTLVIFTSDNGPHNEGKHNHEFFNSNGALRGYKRDIFEGGIRVPMIAYWQNKIQLGVVSDYIGGFHDFMSTFADIANETVSPQTHGLSLLPVLTGQEHPNHASLYWENWEVYKGKRVLKQGVRVGNWKAVRYGADAPIELFDIENDLSEQHNLAAKNPAVTNLMKGLLESSRVESKYYPCK